MVSRYRKNSLWPSHIRSQQAASLSFGKLAWQGICFALPLPHWWAGLGGSKNAKVAFQQDFANDLALPAQTRKERGRRIKPEIT